MSGGRVEPAARAFDLVLRGGTVIDGSADARPFVADVGVLDGRVVAIGDLGEVPAVADDLDVRGRVVCPGFIDPHTHVDAAVLGERDEAELPVAQGVTTCLLGADGFGWAPLPRDGARQLWGATAAVHGPWPDHVPTETVVDYLDHLTGRLPFHVLPQAPHHAVRFAAGGWTSRGDDAVLQRSLDAWLDAGATGLAVGLDYEPGARADGAELERLCASVARTGGSLAAHIRYQDLGRAAAWSEVVAVAERTGVRLNVAHERLDDVGHAALDAARARIDVHVETYPYEAACTHLAIYVRAAHRVGGAAGIAERLHDPALARRVAAELDDDLGVEIAAGDRFVIAASVDGSRIGRDLVDAAAHAGMPLGEFAMQLLRDDPALLLVIHHDQADGHTVTWRTIADPAAIVASDGVYVPGRIHPRGAGTFPRVLRAAIDGAPGLDLPGAIHAMTGRTAEAYRVPGRGRLVEGAVADVVVVDPATVRDRATFDRPRERPTGIEHVIVEGTAVVRDGAVTGRRPGRLLAARGPA